MPTSNIYLAGEVLAMVDQCDPHRFVLDVGPGHGKYAVLLREYLNVPPVVIDAVELTDTYIVAHHLNALYEEVLGGDVCLLPTSTLAVYDVVLMVDVIEHIDKDAAFGLLSRIPRRVVICTPVEWFDNDPRHEHPPAEAHVSHWTEADWDRLREVRPVEVCYQSCGGWLVRLGPIGSDRSA